MRESAGRNAKQARCYVVHGRVQGVGFRYFVECCAQQLGVAGYVRNRFDGTVEVYATGDSEQLAALRKQLWSGPLFGRVDNVEEREAPLRDVRAFTIEF